MNQTDFTGFSMPGAAGSNAAFPQCGSGYHAAIPFFGYMLSLFHRIASLAPCSKIISQSPVAFQIVV